MKKKIFYTKPSITELEISYSADAAANGWGDGCYAYIERFEDLIKTHLNVKHAIATSSCTGALHLGLAALGIGFGDEVILADTNWIATAAPIVHLGAKPVFVDILKDSWCIDPEKVECAITSRTKAIIVTHLYGNLCEMNQLLAISKKYRIPLVEDAAEAIGSSYFGMSAGTMGTFGTFSFHGTKTITTGEGGCFVTNDKELYEKVLTLSNHGRSKQQTKQFWADAVGFKFKMANIQAAIGCAQIERIQELISRKREILQSYKSKLISIPGISLNPEPPNTVNGAWMPTIVFSEDMRITRELLQSKFAAENIDARVFFWPLSGLDIFEAVHENIYAWSIPKRAINLPSFHDITEREIDRVCDLVRKLTNKQF